MYHDVHQHGTVVFVLGRKLIRINAQFELGENVEVSCHVSAKKTLHYELSSLSPLVLWQLAQYVGIFFRQELPRERAVVILVDLLKTTAGLKQYMPTSKWSAPVEITNKLPSGRYTTGLTATGCLSKTDRILRRDQCQRRAQ